MGTEVYKKKVGDPVEKPVEIFENLAKLFPTISKGAKILVNLTGQFYWQSSTIILALRWESLVERQVESENIKRERER